jgi:hypothetical protein
MYLNVVSSLLLPATSGFVYCQAALCDAHTGVAETNILGKEELTHRPFVHGGLEET